jgi:hypothetical protein
MVRTERNLPNDDLTGFLLQIPPLQPEQVATRRTDRPIARASASDPSHIQPAAPSAGGPQKRGPKRGELPCFTWQKSGTCPKGDKCWYTHNPLVGTSFSYHYLSHRRLPQVSEAIERRRQEEVEAARIREETAHRRRIQEEAVLEAQEQARLMRERQLAEEHQQRQRMQEEVRIERERLRQARLAQEEEDRRVREAEMERRFQARSREEATLTLQHVISGSIVTFAAGLEVQHIITGFDCCTVKIKGLPADAREDEVVSLFTQQGVNRAQFQFVGMKGAPNARKEATVVTAADLADLLSFGLDGVEFRRETIDFEIGSYNVPGGMGMASVRDADVLTVSWRAPSLSYVATYDDQAHARAQVRQLNGTMLDGRRLRIEMNTAPPGRNLLHIDHNSVKISNVSPLSPFDQIEALVDTFRLRCLPNRSTALPEANSFPLLLREVEALASGKVTHHEPSTRDCARAPDGTVAYRIRFSTPEDARLAHDGLRGRIFPSISPTALSFKLPEAMAFNLTISREQHVAQKTLWDALHAGIPDRKECNLFIRPDGNLVRVRLAGNSKRAVGMLKVRVENLAMGEVIDGWHRALGFSKNTFLRRVFQETQVYVRSDWRKQVLRVCGEARSVERAQEMIKVEIERLEGLEYTVMLKQVSVAFFVRQGIATLKELVGEDTVTFQPRSRRITITGGEEARHHLSRLIDESFQGVHRVIPNEQQCPVCFDDVASPFRLGCGHTYCTACLRHFLASATEGDQFPLVCMGDESRCGRPIALPTIQSFLPQTKFADLLESAVDSYVKKHPTEIKHCRTPDCTQVYRSTEQPTANALQCPSCFTEVCSGCSEDAHKGRSCEEQRRMTRWDVDDQWMTEQGLRKCPSCSTSCPPTRLNQGLTPVQMLLFRRTVAATIWSAGRLGLSACTSDTDHFIDVEPTSVGYACRRSKQASSMCICAKRTGAYTMQRMLPCRTSTSTNSSKPSEKRKEPAAHLALSQHSSRWATLTSMPSMHSSRHACRRLDYVSNNCKSGVQQRLYKSRNDRGRNSGRGIRTLAETSFVERNFVGRSFFEGRRPGVAVRRVGGVLSCDVLVSKV